MLMLAMAANSMTATNMRGDVDDDGTLSIADVTILIDYMLEHSTILNATNADLDRDGSINIADVTILVDCILGAVTFPPDEEEFNVGDVTFTMMPVEGGTFMKTIPKDKSNSSRL